MFKLERKFGYEPNLDFNKPLVDQVRQETKDIIAYLLYSCWLVDEKQKAELKAQVDENARRVKEERRAARARMRQSSSNMDMPLNQAIDKAIENLKPKS